MSWVMEMNLIGRHTLVKAIDSVTILQPWEHGDTCMMMFKASDLPITDQFCTVIFDKSRKLKV